MIGIFRKLLFSCFNKYTHNNVVSISLWFGSINLTTVKSFYYVGSHALTSSHVKHLSLSIPFS